MDTCCVSFWKLFGFYDDFLSCAEADSHGLPVQQTIVLPLLQCIDKVIDVFVQVQLVVRLWETVEIPQCSSSYSCLDPVVDFPVVAQMQIPFFRLSTFIVQVQQFSSAHVEETAVLPQLHLVEIFGPGC